MSAVGERVALEARTTTAGSASSWAIYFGWIVIILDGAALNLALPTIARELHAGTAGTEWVVDAYTLPLASLLLSAGSLGDRIGAVRLFRWSAVVFSIAAVLSALSPSLPVLIAARALQGVSAAGLLPMVLALIGKTIPSARERGRAANMLSIFGGGAMAAGPCLGGLLTGTIGWRFVFWLTVPPALAAAALMRDMPEVPSDGRRRFDAAGQVSGAVAITALVAGLIEGGSQGWGSDSVISLLAGGLVLLAVFITIERRSREPMMPPALFHHAAFRAVSLGGFVFQLGGFGLPFLLALYLQRAWGASPLAAGLTMLPFAIGISGAGIVVNPRIVHRGARSMMIVGAVTAIIGTAMILAVAGAAGRPLLMLALLIVGLGQGIYSTALNITVNVAVGPSQAGIAAGVYNTARQSGQAVAFAVLGAFAATADAHAGMHAGIGICTACPAIVLALALATKSLASAES